MTFYKLLYLFILILYDMDHTERTFSQKYLKSKWSCIYVLVSQLFTFVRVGIDVWHAGQQHCHGILRLAVRKHPRVRARTRLWIGRHVRLHSVRTRDLAITRCGRVICWPEHPAQTVVWKKKKWNVDKTHVSGTFHPKKVLSRCLKSLWWF